MRPQRLAFCVFRFGGGSGGGGGGGGGSGGGGSVGGGRAVSWFLKRRSGRTDLRTDPLMEMRGRI